MSAKPKTKESAQEVLAAVRNLTTGLKQMTVALRACHALSIEPADLEATLKGLRFKNMPYELLDEFRQCANEMNLQPGELLPAVRALVREAEEARKWLVALGSRSVQAATLAEVLRIALAPFLPPGEAGEGATEALGG